MKIKTALLIIAFQCLIKIGFSQLYNGVNLAGAEFNEAVVPGNYNGNYTYPGAASLDYYNGLGLKLMRLPFLWERLQHALYGPLEESELGHIDDFIALAKERKMLVILDVHNYARRDVDGKKLRIGTPEVPRAAFADFWKKVAEHYKNEKSIWAFDLSNEPHDMRLYSWFQTAQEAIAGIRKVDKTHLILVGGNDWSSADRWPEQSDSLKFLKDPADKIIYEAHLYFDSDASGRYKKSYELEGGKPLLGVERASHFVEWLKLNGKKGFMGEYGIPDTDERWNLVLDNTLKYLKENGVNGTYWAGGPWWGEYPMGIEKTTDVDRPQIKTLVKYLTVEGK
jgi:aryl-phospho-beta-D-glucosidase BglC (GH1 family)